VAKRCRATLELDETYECDRRKGHKGRHRERMYGADETGQYDARVRWRRWKDRRS
jgi:hypothetical protein